MKKLIIAALLVIGVSAFAQDGNDSDKKSDRPKKEKLSPEQKNQAMLDKMTTELSLTPQQQEQIKPIIADQSAKNQAMRDQRMGNNSKEMTDEEREAFKQKRKDEKTAMESKLKTILTPEQFKKMKANEEANKEKMREAREGRDNRQQD